MTTCQWIGSDADYTRLEPTCCAPAVQGKSYCTEHVWQVYRQGSAQGRRKKDIKIASDVRLWESLFNDAVQELEEEGFL